MDGDFQRYHICNNDQKFLPARAAEKCPFLLKTVVCLSHVMYSVTPRPRRALECNGGLVLELGQVYVDDCRSAHTLEHSTPQEDSNMWIVNWYADQISLVLLGSLR